MKNQHSKVMRGGRLRGGRHLFLPLLLVALVLLAPGSVKPVTAACCCICNLTCTGCTLSEFTNNLDKIWSDAFDTMSHFGMVEPLPRPTYFINAASPIGIDIRGQAQGTGRLGEHQEFIWEKIWFNPDSDKGWFLPWFMMMSEQLTTTMVWHTQTIGMFLDAKNLMETQSLLQERMADVHKRYQPSVSMCVIGTNMRGMAASERKGELVSHTLNQRLLDRLLGTEGSSAPMGHLSDQAGRVRFFLSRVCDRFDNNRLADDPNTGFGNICSTTPRTDGTVNLDLDFTRLIMTPRTLNVDFTDLTDPRNIDGDHVFNLAANIYGHKVPGILKIGTEGQYGLGDRLLDLRSAVAKRSVAQASYNALVALKARGTQDMGNDTRKYLYPLLQDLGMSQGDVDTFLGESPSYYAQMEVMAKKLYQNPDFYRELYDKPDNVRRKSVAMSAIAAMLDREIFESSMRAEAMISQILELRVVKKQESVESAFSARGRSK